MGGQEVEILPYVGYTRRLDLGKCGIIKKAKLTRLKQEQVMDSLKTLAEFRGDSIRQLSCTIRFFVDDVKETNKQTKVFCRFNLEAVEQREPLGWGRLIPAQGDMGLS